MEPSRWRLCRWSEKEEEFLYSENNFLGRNFVQDQHKTTVHLLSKGLLSKRKWDVSWWWWGKKESSLQVSKLPLVPLFSSAKKRQRKEMHLTIGEHKGAHTCTTYFSCFLSHFARDFLFSLQQLDQKETCWLPFFLSQSSTGKRMLLPSGCLALLSHSLSILSFYSFSPCCVK